MCNILVCIAVWSAFTAKEYGIAGCGYWLVYLRHTPYYPMPIEQEQKEIDIAEEY